MYGLERPPPGQFCLQPDVEDAVFCADFDDEGDSDPLAPFVLVDDLSRYSADADAAHSAPFGARLTLSGVSVADARMQRLVEVGSELSASVWFHIAAINRPPVEYVKVIALQFGENAAERVVYVTSNGTIIQKIGTTFPTVSQIDALPTGRWVHLELAIDLTSNAGRIVVDDEVTTFEYAPIAAPMPTNRARMIIGPHDAEPHDGPIEIVMLYDDIVIH